jgi:cytochrome c-type biogenesis protein CcmF
VRQFTESFYLNEHLWYGHLGQFLIIAAFISALFTFYFGLKYYLATEKNEQILTYTKTFFKVHFISVIGTILLLIFLFKAQYFEYHYIWRHSSSELPWYFIFSALWEGQEGSFLLWIFWHAILGALLWRNVTENKVGVVAILCFVQALLLTMILGVDVLGKLIGTNPFILLRNEMNIPILNNPNYIALIKDGNGLNVLLQNYWMVIHPPVLFLGFASTTVPFGFALSSLLKRDFTSWTKEVSPWSLFSMAVLGLGILMGGRWAYEALSFGGFWAWDPVENASLVPWLFLVAGVHTLMVYKSTSHSLKATYVLFILAFGFVLYSTFLTRSGILGDSSVHSFTDLGMTGQLLIFLGILVIPSFILIAYFWSRIPDVKIEEKTSSREFWMFMGALFFVVSALQITFTTSIPVWNKLFDLTQAPPVNPNAHYNGIQIWFASIVCFLMGASLWLKYRATEDRKIFIKFAITYLVSLVIAMLYMYSQNIEFLQKYILEIKEWKMTLHFISTFMILFASSISLIWLSLFYIYKQLRNADKLYWGGSIAHIGFGLLILGALISQYQKKAISVNKAGIDLGKEFDVEEQTSNTLLMQGQKEEMGQYWVTYKGKSPAFKGEQYHFLFQDKKNLADSFPLTSEAKIIKEGENNRLNPEPGIRHLLGKDIFAHVSSVPDFSDAKGKANTKKAKLHDTFYTGDKFVVFDKVIAAEKKAENMIDLKAQLLISNLEGKQEAMLIPFKLNTKTGAVTNPIIYNKDSMLSVNLILISPEEQEFHFSVMDKSTPNEWVILKVLEFPNISILWIGCILMTVGAIMSMMYRRRKNQLANL